MSDPNEEKNVEELLSQLQGIFGKLSQADETDASGKTDLPVAAPAPTPQPRPAPDPLPSSPVPEPVAAKPPPPVPEPVPVPVPPPSDPIPEPQTRLSSDTPVEVSSEAVMPTPEMPQVYDALTIGCAIYYPLMREKEAKVLAQKIETMTPKFTKLAFKLKVGFIVSYDPRSDWRDAAITRVRENNIRALFLLSDRVLDDAKRRAMQVDLEAHLIYFQEVPMLSLEKKAFFTDVLLGMVFFFDTLKPKPPGE